MITENHSNEQNLKAKTKTRDFFKGILLGTFILWLFIIAAACYFYSKKGNISLFIPVFSLIVVFFPIYLRFKSLDSEVKSKELD